MREAFVVAAKRTAIGKLGGELREVEPQDLASAVLRAVVNEMGIRKEEVEEIILGNVVGPGGNMGRLSALSAGFPDTTPGVAIDLQCGSGLQAIHIAAYEVIMGQRDLVIAGGVESSSRAPWKVQKPLNLYGAIGPAFFQRARFAPYEIGDPDMGVAAENVAKQYRVSREDQDAFSLLSHQKAVHAIKESKMVPEIAPFCLRDGTWFDQDEGPRSDTSLGKLSKLPPVFIPDGTVTAGNACGINDGAAVVMIASGDACKRLGLRPVLRYMDSELVGVDPNYLGIGPIPAVRRLLTRTQLAMDEIDLIELNEAFASQVIASVRELSMPMDRLNVNGGAIALGHPYGASGAILLTRLFYELQRRKGKYGLATLGVGGGLGIASVWERVVCY